jgi:hypothetical protein
VTHPPTRSRRSSAGRVRDSSPYFDIKLSQCWGQKTNGEIMIMIFIRVRRGESRAGPGPVGSARFVGL